MEKGAGLAEEARLTLEFSLSFSLLLPLVNKNTFFLIGIFFSSSKLSNSFCYRGLGVWEGTGGGIAGRKRRRRSGLKRRRSRKKESVIEKKTKSFAPSLFSFDALPLSAALSNSPAPGAVTSSHLRAFSSAQTNATLPRPRFPLQTLQSMSRLFAPPGRLVERDVEQEEGRPPGQPRGRGAHGAREHRVGAPRVELLVVDHGGERRKKEEEAFFFSRRAKNVFHFSSASKNFFFEFQKRKSKEASPSLPSLPLSPSVFLVTMTGADAPTSTSGSVPAGEDKAKMTFKGAARLVVAARRFQGAREEFVFPPSLSLPLSLSPLLVVAQRRQRGVSTRARECVKRGSEIGQSRSEEQG